LQRKNSEPAALGRGISRLEKFSVCPAQTILLIYKPGRSGQVSAMLQEQGKSLILKGAYLTADVRRTVS
jgi:hypothetical protein